MNPTGAFFVSLLLACLPASAQDTAPDLSAQRHEMQGVNPVPGSAVKRTPGTTVISPTPREADISASDFLAVGLGMKADVPADLREAVLATLPSPSAGDSATAPAAMSFSFDKKGKAFLTVRYGNKAADKARVPAHAEAYRLTVDGHGISITGRDRRGALYGLRTLAQLFRGPYAQFSLVPECDIADWPELSHRGLVEGFYGTPWSHDTRLALIDYLGANKMNTYIYGPKDDPYHSSPHWRKPYPPEQAANIRELAERARKAGVDFVWAIHPGKDIRWDDADRDSLVAKFEMMYGLGVRGFAVFFDDIEGIGTDPRRQTDLLNYLNRNFVARKGDVAPLAVCPTEYSRSWINPREGGANDIYGRTLDEGINVFYTGDAVCSDMTAETLAFMKRLIRRPPYFWWNFPVSDYCRNFILQGPAYGLDTTVTAADCAGILSNPMEHGTASMPALYALADYAWNPAAFNAMDAWERALADVAGTRAAKAYRDFAINSADTRTGYRRDESWEMPDLPADPAQIIPEQRSELRALFYALRDAPDSLRTLSADTALTAELEPWLVQAEALGSRLLTALALTETTDSGATRWEAIANALPTPQEQEAYEAHTLGTLRLIPFHRAVTEDAARRFFAGEAGREPALAGFSGSYPNLASEAPMAMADGDTATFYHSAYGQRPGDFITFDLGTVIPVTEIYLLQGRHEGDTDFFDAFTIATSLDGTEWTPLTAAPVRDTYEYRHKGIPVDARFIRLNRDDSSRRTHWTAIRELAVNPASLEERGLSSADLFTLLPPAWGRAIDNNPVTAVTLMPDTPIVLQLPEGSSSVTILAGREGTDLTAAWLDADGHAVTFTDLRSPYNRAAIPAGTCAMRLGGMAVIHEIIVR